MKELDNFLEAKNQCKSINIKESIPQSDFQNNIIKELEKKENTLTSLNRFFSFYPEKIDLQDQSQVTLLLIKNKNAI